MNTKRTIACIVWMVFVLVLIAFSSCNDNAAVIPSSNSMCVYNIDTVYINTHPHEVIKCYHISASGMGVFHSPECTFCKNNK